MIYLYDDLRFIMEKYFRKRYDRAEKEYIGAKMNLYTFKEKKELLTSHLCTIIEKNELRKAQKLSDLMRKLEMGMDISSLVVSYIYFYLIILLVHLRATCAFKLIKRVSKCGKL